MATYDPTLDDDLQEVLRACAFIAHVTGARDCWSDQELVAFLDEGVEDGSIDLTPLESELLARLAGYVEDTKRNEDQARRDSQERIERNNADLSSPPDCWL